MTLDLLQKIAIYQWRETFWYDAAFSTIANKLFVVRPSPDSVHCAHGDVASDYILRLLMEKFADAFDDFAGILMRMLTVVTTVNPAPSIRRHLHEIACHKYLMKTARYPHHVNEKLYEMVPERTKGSNNISLSVPKCPRTKMLLSLVSRVPYNFEDGSPPSSLSKTRYYMPKATTNPTFDSFFVRKGELYAFQMTKHDGANEKSLGGDNEIKEQSQRLQFCVLSFP